MHSFYCPTVFEGEFGVVKLYVEEYYNSWDDSEEKRVYDLKKQKQSKALIDSGRKPPHLYMRKGMFLLIV